MKNPAIKIGDVVRVKAGVTDPDDPSIDWGGWHGRVIEIGPASERPRTLTIELDSLTLRSLPPDYIIASEEEGLDWTQLSLYFNDVEPAEPRDTPEDVEDAQEELSEQYRWAYLGEEGMRIQAVLGDAEDEWEEAKAWAEYLEAHLTFPFDARVAEWQERGPLRTGDRLRVLAIEDVDETYGVIVKCRRGRQVFHTLLADLEVIDHSSQAHRLVSDYGTWFANR